MLVPIPGSDGSYTYDPSVPAPSGGGGGGGGGGSSDFSTAKVNFINSANGKYYTVKYIGVTEFGLHYFPQFSVDVSENVEMVLYKGMYTLSLMDFDEVDDQTMPECTGDITLDLDELAFIITGDGSITMKGTGSIN